MIDLSVPILAASLQDQPPYVVALLILGIVLVTASMMIGLRNRKKKTATHATARENLERAKQKEGLKRDIEVLAVEIEELARRVGTQLDNKAARIEALLDQAEAAIARLEQARANLLTPPPTSSPPAPPSVQSEPGRVGPDPAAPTESSATPGEDPGPTRAGSLNTPDRLTADTYRLADSGFSADEIARSTGEHVGKIELILALRQNPSIPEKP